MAASWGERDYHERAQGTQREERGSIVHMYALSYLCRPAVFVSVLIYRCVLADRNLQSILLKASSVLSVSSVV